VTFVAPVLAIAIAALGILGMAAPDRLLVTVRRFMTSRGLAFAAGIWLVLGAALWLAAPESRAPDLLRVLGVITVIAGIATPFVGVERARRLFDWWAERSPWTVRAAGRSSARSLGGCCSLA
jgi:uncharacterized membrane protein